MTKYLAMLIGLHYYQLHACGVVCLPHHTFPHLQDLGKGKKESQERLYAMLGLVVKYWHYL